MDHSSPQATKRIPEESSLNFVMLFGTLTALTALAFYGYLGTFSRYGSDDYCLSAFFFKDNLLNAMILRYFEASSRYTNILFIGLVDNLFGWHNVAILPALMLALFVLSLYLFIREISRMARWNWSRWMILFLSVLVVYFSVSQAPDLYETLYWRAGMTSHFAPVVFIPFFGAFLLRQIQNTTSGLPALWIQAACFLLPFLIGGLSEPPTALMVTVLALGILAAWRWSDARQRRSILVLLIWALAGALTALIVMALAPANSIRMTTPPPPLPELLSRIVSYPLYFIVDTLRALPIPTLISIAVPALLFYVKYTSTPDGFSAQTRTHLALLLIIVLFLAYLIIAASFAPSAYGQSYPAPRARFSGRAVMSIVLMTEGALLGALLTQALRPLYLRRLAVVALAILALYPLRTAQRLLPEIPVYQQRAVAWDAREAEIVAMKAQGERDLLVRFLSKERLQDLGDRTDFRLNRCASALYGVDSILAVPMDK